MAIQCVFLVGVLAAVIGGEILMIETRIFDKIVGFLARKRIDKMLENNPYLDPPKKN